MKKEVFASIIGAIEMSMRRNDEIGETLQRSLDKNRNELARDFIVGPEFLFRDDMLYDELIHALMVEMNDVETEWISVFAHEMDFGNENNRVYVDDGIIVLDSAEKLYDFLVCGSEGIGDLVPYAFGGKAVGCKKRGTNIGCYERFVVKDVEKDFEHLSEWIGGGEISLCDGYISVMFDGVCDFERVEAGDVIVRSSGVGTSHVPFTRMGLDEFNSEYE